MLVVQSMVASRYTHFKKETLEWQRSLSFVSDVMSMLNGIQVSLPLYFQVLCPRVTPPCYTPLSHPPVIPPYHTPLSYLPPYHSPLSSPLTTPPRLHLKYSGVGGTLFSSIVRPQQHGRTVCVHGHHCPSSDLAPPNPPPIHTQHAQPSTRPYDADVNR